MSHGLGSRFLRKSNISTLYKVFNGIPFKYTPLGILPYNNINTGQKYNLNCENNVNTLDCLSRITNDMILNDISFYYYPPFRIDRGWCYNIDYETQKQNWWFMKNTDASRIEESIPIIMQNTNKGTRKVYIDYLPCIHIIEPTYAQEAYST